MPCTYTPSAEEIAESKRLEREADDAKALEKEKQLAFRRYGVRDSELNIATRVACNLAKGIRDDLVERWLTHHNKMDRARRKAEALATIESTLAAELENYAKVRRAELEKEHAYEE